MKEYLFDKEFLKQLDYYREKETHVRIISLTNDEYPREQIEGRATGGSINIDGTSTVRRSCSLNMVALDDEVMLTDKFWCYNNKFKLEVGLKNLIDNKYPDIVWFDMGIYIITSFSKSKNTNNLSISLSGKDKMCRLNGEVSGNIMMSTDFGTIEETTKVEETDPQTGETKEIYRTTITKLPIYTIIQNALKEYAQERAENIIINDLDQYGYELWEYRGDEPMYLFIDPTTTEYSAQVINMTFNGDTAVEFAGAGYEGEQPILKSFETCGGKFFSMNTLDANYNVDATKINFSDKECYVAKIGYGETAGYHRIPLVYNNDLVLNAGETVTTLLDKLKNMLGDFEYFYDLQGRFVFQKKNTYIQELFSPTDGELVTPTMYASPYSYKFEDTQLFIAISNSPNINNLKNDFSIWGTRKSATGDDLPIHARYAVNKKPSEYKLVYSRYTRYTKLCYIIAELITDIMSEEDFQQISSNIYYMSNNQYQLANKYEENTSYYKLTEKSEKKQGSVLCKKEADSYTKLTAEEMDQLYYKDNQGNYVLITTDKATPVFPYYFIASEQQKAGYLYRATDYDWRELIYQMAIDFYGYNQESDFLIKLAEANPQFIDGKTGYEQYYSDMQAFWRQLYNPEAKEQEDGLYDELLGISYYKDGNKKYWNKQIHLDPNALNFWFDFLDSGGELNNYGVDRIGSRSKIVNETSIKSIYFRETPEVLFIVSPRETLEEIQMAYMPIWIQDSMEGLFYRSAQGAAAISKANELIYQHTATVENISLTSIPIYYLEPNTRIYIKDQGDYTLDKITYSLNYNGTMVLSGSKIMKQFY